MNINLLGHGSRYEVCRKALLDNGHKFVELDDADLIVMANHNKILPREVYRKPRFGAINCHGGKLPKYRGSSPLNWQIINGETRGGVSILEVEEGIDEGGIYAFKDFDIEIMDTIVEVRQKADALFAEMLPRVVRDIEDSCAMPIAQICVKGIQEPTYWHHRQLEDSKIHWGRMTAKQVYDLVRACEEPYWAFTAWHLRTSIIKRAKLPDDTYCGIPGRVVKQLEDGFVVIASDRGVWVKGALKVGEQLR